MSQSPVLYSFRRCPYAIRARLALQMTGTRVELREIELKNKPASMLAYSAKGTVPVMVLPDNTVIDESLDIMLWALNQRDPSACLQNAYTESLALIEENDGPFKHHLDRYKYADRYPEKTELAHRADAEAFIGQLNTMLANSLYLFNDQPSLADLAIAPFVRQFAHVDLAWFESSQYSHTLAWLNRFKASELFLATMKKYRPWQPEDEPIYFGADT